MEQEQKIELINYLTGFISDSRKKRFDEVIAQRTDHLRIVLEDVYQGHNASAILRSCDCFGVQNIHYIEKRNNIKISADVDMGSSKWLNIHKHRGEENNTLNAIRELKSKGYRIVATTPHKNDCTIDKLPVDKKYLLSDKLDSNYPKYFAKMNAQTITLETNGVIFDGHYSKIGHEVIGNLFYEHITTYKNG